MYQCIVIAAYTKCWCCLIQLTVKKSPPPPVSIPLPPPILVPCIRNVLCHHQPSRPYRVPTNLLKSSSSWFNAFCCFVVVRRSHNGGNDEGLGPVCNCAYCLRMNDLIVFWSYAVTEANKDGGIYLGFAWALWDDDMVGWWPMRSQDLQITIHPSIHFHISIHHIQWEININHTMMHEESEDASPDIIFVHHCFLLIVLVYKDFTYRRQGSRQGCGRVDG